MARGTLIRPSQVSPFEYSPVFTSRMLLDHTNSESKQTHVNHATLKAGGNLLPPSAHGKPGEPYDETYVILKGHCKLLLDGEWLQLQPSDVIFIPSGTSHGLDNTEGIEDVEILTIWNGVPPKGINSVYDMRLAQWGKSYKTINEP
ncbi:MAG: hypothetical protein AMJ70_05015 [Dehalococcoidia bacterium SG8_51_3]|nr:MAG: hypothetical protein AMJ70_05015 [Dehalococcoidia bacterium SG8_51_3]